MKGEQKQTKTHVYKYKFYKITKTDANLRPEKHVSPVAEVRMKMEF